MTFSQLYLITGGINLILFILLVYMMVKIDDENLIVVEAILGMILIGLSVIGTVVILALMGKLIKDNYSFKIRQILYTPIVKSKSNRRTNNTRDRNDWL